jgi:iron complex transport system ATP-binding protein
MIKLNNISFAYDSDHSVLRGISLEMKKGEFAGILGPNGSGKTTLLKIISGTLRHDKGEVLINGKMLSRMSWREKARIIAVVPQESTIPFSFSSLEVVLMGRAPYLPLFGFESKEDISIARKMMEDLDVIQFERRPIQELSGGEKQRVIVARALAQKPKILLLDEPAAFLDIRHEMELYRLIKRKNREDGLTVVSVVHDINLASTFCDRIIFLKEGKIIADGTPHEVVRYAKIREVFDTDVYVGINDLTGMPYYVPYNE